ncbi:putative HVA22-like protein a [Cocos nucifera]|uniref:HVA22-like protein n=1 Tax=Cocos nucifera TaxID=13894 RepID=A0A8K0IU82_COCNU|nr:putative HVA22-like protein a [Cocos nucifera]
MRAIESPSSLDDQQWLTYWMLYSLITLFELTCWNVLQWFLLWPYMKLVFCLWLVLPIFNGAAYIYENFVRRYVKIGNYAGSRYPEDQRRILQMLNLDSRKPVEQYIEKYGSEAFQRVVEASTCCSLINYGNSYKISNGAGQKGGQETLNKMLEKDALPLLLLSTLENTVMYGEAIIV